MAEEKAKTESVKSKEQIEAEADKARKAKIDVVNKKKAEEVAKKEAELAKMPLNKEENAFIARIRPQMNDGRNPPAPADILRYSRLIKRKGVK